MIRVHLVPTSTRAITLFFFFKMIRKEVDLFREKHTSQSVGHLRRYEWPKAITFCLLLGNCKSEKAVAPHSSILAWKIPWMEEPGGRSPWGH